MNHYVIKIDGKYVKEFIETDEESSIHVGGWHNHARRAITVPELGRREEAHIYSGWLNLKSVMTKIAMMEREGFVFDELIFECIERENQNVQ